MSRCRFSLLIAFFSVICTPVVLNSQESGTGGYFAGVRVGYGFLWAHRPTMSHLVNKHIPAIELSLWKTTNQTKCWHQPYKNPRSGATITVIPLGDERLGTGIGLYPYVLFPLSSKSKKLTLNFQVGWGVGWITNKFDPLENHKNNAIGSHLNTIILFRTTANYDCSDRLNFEAGLGLTHFSNGAMTLPNLGLNIPMLEAGFHYRIAMKNEVCDEKTTLRNMYADSLVNNDNWHFTALAAFGANDIGTPGGNRFGAANIQTSVVKNTGRKHRFGGGVDFMYSQGAHHILVYGDKPTSALGAVQVGAKFTYELVLGRFYLPFEMGVYAYSKYKDTGPVYNRLAARYLITDHLVAGISLKSHLARAEYWEAGIGWRI